MRHSRLRTLRHSISFLLGVLLAPQAFSQVGEWRVVPDSGGVSALAALQKSLGPLAPDDPILAILDLQGANLRSSDAARAELRKFLASKLKIADALGRGRGVVLHLVTWAPGSDGIGPSYEIKSQSWYGLTKDHTEVLDGFGGGKPGSDLMLDRLALTFLAIHIGLPEDLLRDALAYDFSQSPSVTKALDSRVIDQRPYFPVPGHSRQTVAGWTARTLPRYGTLPVLSVQLRQALAKEPDVGKWPVLSHLEIYRPATSKIWDLQFTIPLKVQSQGRVDINGVEKRSTVFRPNVGLAIPMWERTEGEINTSLFVGFPVESQMFKKPVAALVFGEILALGVAFRPYYSGRPNGGFSTSYEYQFYMGIHFGYSRGFFNNLTGSRRTTAAR